MPTEHPEAPEESGQKGELAFEYHEDETRQEELERPFARTPDVEQELVKHTAVQPRGKKRKGLSSKQWILLIVVAMVECVLLAVFVYLILQNM
jgi:hypothetical protein